VGEQFLKLALDRGDTVRAVFRVPPPFPPAPRLEVLVIPDLLNPAAIAAAIAGSDAVVSTLGLRRKHPRNPFSRLVSPPNFTSQFARLLVQAMQTSNAPQQGVAISAAGVGDSRARMAVLLRLLFDMSNVGVAYADLEVMEAVFMSSGLDWTCVRPTTLTNGAQTEQVRLTDQYSLMNSISRADVAWFMRRCLDQSGHQHPRTPMITH
jgi:putative NADH-flavin reductase